MISANSLETYLHRGRILWMMFWYQTWYMCCRGRAGENARVKPSSILNTASCLEASYRTLIWDFYFVYSLLLTYDMFHICEHLQFQRASHPGEGYTMASSCAAAIEANRDEDQVNSWLFSRHVGWCEAAADQWRRKLDEEGTELKKQLQMCQNRLKTTDSESRLRIRMHS